MIDTVLRVLVCVLFGDEWYSGCFMFFFQAEDGIRDLVRSRGLGDVYKRQGHGCPRDIGDAETGPSFPSSGLPDGKSVFDALATVSYTHLTLPTSDLV